MAIYKEWGSTRERTREMKRLHKHDGDEAGFRKDVTEAADKYPFFRVHLSASNRELMVMPIELLMEKIIGGNIFVFVALVRSNKALGELLEDIPGIYRYLFYNVFVNERVVMSDMVQPRRLTQMAHIIKMHYSQADEEGCSSEELAIFSLDPALRIGRGEEEEEYNALEIKYYADVQRDLPTVGGGTKSDPFLSDSSIINNPTKPVS